MPTLRQAAAPCDRPDRVDARRRHGAARVRADRAGAAASAAVVADSKRNYVYGLHAVNAALERAPERVLELWIAQPREAQGRVRQLQERAHTAGVHIHAVPPDGLIKLVGDVAHQGAVAAMRPLKGWDEHDLGELLDRLTVDPLLLILDGVTDPHNLGACLRTADAAGADAVIIPKDRAATLDSVARKVAAGAAEFIPVVSVTNLARTLEALKRRGVWIVGTEAEAAQTLYSADFRRPLAVVLGAEGAGMRRLTREKCDFLLRIPMVGHMESLNVSVSAGIVLFEVLRQRGG
jgi:23S rRNA (guanosine2251-2'-O)-methyltransferase